MLKIPDLVPQVWILAAGRLLSEIGTGFTLFYAPIFFVNQVGISATLVGIALGSGSISGVIGRFLGGQWVDSPDWGRKKTLLVATAVSALANLVLIMTANFSTLIIGNLLMGLGIGIYWPATETAIIDLTNVQQRNEAFAITRLADSLGLGLGVVLGGALIANSGNYRSLFLIDGISFVIFFGIIYWAIAETGQFKVRSTESNNSGWLFALQDRSLMIYLVVNVLFTIYLSQVQSTMPLYLKNFVTTDNGVGLSEKIISGLFSFHIAFSALCQLPVARLLNRVGRIQGLMFSLVLWGIGFSLMCLTGYLTSNTLIWAIVALGVMSLATISYHPSASSFVADLAPETLRGVYLSLNSQCWAVGYFIGPPLGGWALDHSPEFVRYFWLFCASSIVLGLIILNYLQRVYRSTLKN
jgi:MFS family permease